MKLTWDAEGERLYETGVNQCALFVYDAAQKKYGEGVAWNGIISITESPSGAETTSLYANNTKYLNLLSVEELSGTIKAYMFPDAWEACDGTAALHGIKGISAGQQARKSFGLAYMTNIGNDTEGSDHDLKLHLIYGAKASPSERAYNTINDSPEANELSWEYKTTPIAITKSDDMKPTSIITIVKSEVGDANWKKIIDMVYGTDETEPKLPTPDELITAFANASAAG